MLTKNLLQSVVESQFAAEYWSVQKELAVEIERYERLIQAKRRWHIRLRNAIKDSASKVPNGKIAVDRLRRLQILLVSNETAEDNHRFSRAAILYLGDTLAYKIMPDHVVRLHGKNKSPGFFGAKDGRAKEIEIGNFMTEKGWTVLLHDLTHCLKIGDLTAICNNRGVVSFEVGSEAGSRKKRQKQRMVLLNQVLQEKFSDLSVDELTAHGFPYAIVEHPCDRTHNTDAFCDVTTLKGHRIRVTQPENGVIYAASVQDCGGEDIAREVMRLGEGWKECIFSCFRDRIMGDYSWVPPITLLGIPVEKILNLLNRNVYFYVFIDVVYLRKRLAELSQSLVVSVEDEMITFSRSEGEWSVVYGPRPIENVKYGLVSLESALKMLATTPTPTYAITNLKE